MLFAVGAPAQTKQKAPADDLHEITLGPNSTRSTAYPLGPSGQTSSRVINICPTTDVDVVVRGGDERALVAMRWGIIPGWWSKPLKEMRLATFNARAESVAQKPMFRDSFKRRRCLMPAPGYYEWHGTPEGKQPYFFTRRDGQVMTIAGLQDGWVDPAAGGEVIRSCAMIITEPNGRVAPKLELIKDLPGMARAAVNRWTRSGAMFF